MHNDQFFSQYDKKKKKVNMKNINTLDVIRKLKFINYVRNMKIYHITKHLIIIITQ